MFSGSQDETERVGGLESVWQQVTEKQVLRCNKPGREGTPFNGMFPDFMGTDYASCMPHSMKK